MTNQAAQKVVILGGGFAGVATAKALSGNSKVAVTLVDKNSYQLYYPSLYEAACEEVTRQTVTIPLSQIFPRGSVELVRGEVTAVNKAEKKVALKSGQNLDYDYLVLTLGAESNDFGIKGVREHTYIFRDLKETVLLRDHIRTIFHLSHERGKEEINVVICGGGFSGVELAAELRHHLGHITEEYHTEVINITILEASPQILLGLDSRVTELSGERLKKLNIDIKLGDPVAEVKKDGVRLKSGTFVPSDVTVWTAGTKSNPIPAAMGLPLDHKGRPVVNESLAVLGYPDIFAAGDLAGFTDPKSGKGIAPQAHYAIEMGRLIGKNIARSVDKLPLRQFHPDALQIIVPVGHNDAVFYDQGRVSSGWWPSFLRKLVEFNYLVSIFGPLKAWPIFWAEMQVMTD